MAEYSYDPTKLNQDGVDRMRFELGDTVVAMGELTSPLCDEEYKAVLEGCKDWKRAKIKCLRAIVMKLSYEVDTSVSGLSYSLSQRFNNWKNMLDEEEKKLAGTLGVPRANPGSISGTPYFYAGMHHNPRGFPEGS